MVRYAGCAIDSSDCDWPSKIGNHGSYSGEDPTCEPSGFAPDSPSLPWGLRELLQLPDRNGFYQYDRLDGPKSRRVEITNFDLIATTTAIIRHYCALSGTHEVNLSEWKNGRIYVRFSYPHSARIFCQSDINVGGRQWQMRLTPNTDDDTIVLFGVRSDVPDQFVRSIFEQIGEVRDVRTSKKPSHERFIEFWDLAHCQDALRAVQSGELKGPWRNAELSKPSTMTPIFGAVAHPTVVRLRDSVRQECHCVRKQ
jgi:hypothetical protein